MSVILLWAAEQFIEVAVANHLTALPFPKVILQTIINLSKILRAFRDVVTAVVFQGPLVTRGTPGRHRQGTQEGAQQKQRQDHLHFCEASSSRVLKRNEIITKRKLFIKRPFFRRLFLSCERKSPICR